MANVATRRIAASNRGPTTINRRRVKIFFQTFPGTKAASGIAGLPFIVQVGTAPAVLGSTPADGHVEILLGAGDTASLKILGSEYQVRLLVGEPFPITQLRGVQQRLNMLGYHAGELQPDDLAAGLGRNQTHATERAIINFQADHDPLFIDGVAGPKTQPKLQQVVRSAGGE
jgi:peptidoglycan hydrolase-like protein with peptidoglycan-binding domain